MVSATTARQPVDVLLSRLKGVRATGPQSWRADCPNGHTSRGTLSVSQTDDGRVLLHCFGCADTPGILGAIGLELADLFPARIKDPSPEARRAAHEAFKRSSWGAALRVLAYEMVVVCAAAEMLKHGAALSPSDGARLATALDRILDARAALT